MTSAHGDKPAETNGDEENDVKQSLIAPSGRSHRSLKLLLCIGVLAIVLLAHTHSCNGIGDRLLLSRFKLSIDELNMAFDLISAKK